MRKSKQKVKMNSDTQNRPSNMQQTDKLDEVITDLYNDMWPISTPLKIILKGFEELQNPHY